MRPGAGELYAVKGSLVCDQWWAWMRGACFAAGVVVVIGMLALGNDNPRTPSAEAI